MAIHEINILGIAPYETMRNNMIRVTQNYPEVHLDVYIGDLEAGAEIARKKLYRGYDVIISRGGTCEMIRKITTIPVVEIGLSSFDILRTIKFTESLPDNYAIVGFPNITNNVRQLSEIMQYNIPVVTVHSAGEVEGVLKKLRSEGITMVLSDNIGSLTARRLGMNSVLMTSGSESINNAFAQATLLIQSYSNYQRENHLLKEVISKEPVYTMVFDENQDLLISGWNDAPDELVTLLRRAVPGVIARQVFKSFQVVDGTLYSISSQLITGRERNYCAFYLQASKVPMISSKYGISFSDRQETEKQYFKSLYSINGVMMEMKKDLQKYSSMSYPVMITGENGTGKEQIARLLYLESNYADRPLVIVNCQLMNQKEWEFLTNNYNSPLDDSDNTIFFQNLEGLPSDWVRLLDSLIQETDLIHRNRLIFSCACLRDGTIPAEVSKLIDHLSCQLFYVPPVRKRPEEIPTMCNVYLASQSTELGRQIIGFEASALEKLQEYDWPGNQTQLKRVINSLCVTTSSSYITKKSVQRVLAQETNQQEEQWHMASGSSGRSIDLDRTLDEITRDVVQQVLKDHNYNQSAAARALGISRSTLWRYNKTR